MTISATIIVTTPITRPSPSAQTAIGMTAAAASVLDGLDPEQREAALAVHGPVCILAGAGTGKTLVLITRFAHILLTGHAYPSQVLAVTFANKAPQEMPERVGAILGRPWKGFPSAHSIRSGREGCAATRTAQVGVRFYHPRY